MNYILITLNVVIFLMTYAFGSQEAALRPWAGGYMLTPMSPHLWQFVTYAFLHGGWLHLAGNMYFLYIFGNNVNDKLGGVSYLCLYLAGGVFSGIGHAAFHASPVLGASGAVAAITGAYMVLFPQTLITIVYWLIFIGTMELSALYFILFKLIVWDNVIAPQITRGIATIAYDAHLAGYVFGIGTMLFMLALGLIGRSQFDLWAMIRRWNLRRQYRSASGGGGTATHSAASRFVKAKIVKKTPAQEKYQQEILELRSNITERLGQGNLAQAAELYVRLNEFDSDQVIARQALLDIANHLMADGKWQESADAYEKFLKHYSSYQYSEQVQLMLGLLCSRYLHRDKDAITHLTAAREKLSDAGQIKMCSEELEKLRH